MSETTELRNQIKFRDPVVLGSMGKRFSCRRTHYNKDSILTPKCSRSIPKKSSIKDLVSFIRQSRQVRVFMFEKDELEEIPRAAPVCHPQPVPDSKSPNSKVLLRKKPQFQGQLSDSKLSDASSMIVPRIRGRSNPNTEKNP